jgi:peptidoglycan/xylan/chitin deacetylase (PgdA/CDA1 family)
MWTTLFALFSTAGPSARLSIVMYHRVHEAADPLFPEEPDAATFDKQIAWLVRCFNVLPMNEALHRLQAGSLPARALCITFDDGYADNLSTAAPILARHRAPATVFVACGFLDGGCMWNDLVIEAIRGCPDSTLDASWLDLGQLPLTSMAERRAAIARVIPRLKYLPPQLRQSHAQRIADEAGVPTPGALMLTSAQLRSLHRQGIGIGAHTVTHPILNAVEPKQARSEIVESKLRLEALVLEPVEVFAYPNGKPGKDFAPLHVDMTKQAGFRAAVTTAPGVAFRGSDPFQLPRFTPWGQNHLLRGLRLARNIASSANASV